jgi:hypothetical protein
MQHDPDCSWVGSDEDEEDHEGLTCAEYDFEFGAGPAPLTEAERVVEIAELEKAWDDWEAEQ